jgi:hypothetical protein
MGFLAFFRFFRVSQGNLLHFWSRHPPKLLDRPKEIQNGIYTLHARRLAAEGLLGYLAQPPTGESGDVTAGVDLDHLAMADR